MVARPQNYRFTQGQTFLPFPDEDYAARIAGLRRIMYDHDLAVVVLTSQHNIAYYTGLMFRAFDRSYALVVTEDECVTIAPAIDGGQPSRRGYGDTIAYTDWERNNFYRTVRSVAGIGKILGYEADVSTVLQAQSMRHHLHPTGLIDISADTMRQRASKSAAEIALIRAGAAVAELGLAAMRDALKSGTREIDVAMVGRDAMEREIATGFPQAEYRDTWAQCLSGINTDGPHNAPTARMLAQGDIVSLSAHPLISGYYAPLSRTFFLGALDDASRKVWEGHCAAQTYARSLIAPGASFAEITSKIDAFYEERDLLQYCAAGHGHSVGLKSHYYGGEAALDLRAYNDATLEAGMLISVAPMLTVPADEPGAGGYREQDILLVTEDGSEALTGAPMGPEACVISA